MPIYMARMGETNYIKKITGKDDVRRFLYNLGFTEGEEVTVISEMAGNLIVSIKNSRIALDKAMAKRIFI